jgi:plasmid stabilization system protein ParE
MEGRAPRFPDPTLEAIANEFVEVLRVKREAEEKLVELFDKFVEEFAGHERRFSDQEIRAITEEIEAMRAMIATRAEPEPGVDIATPAPPPHILPYFEDINSGYLHWVLRNIDNDQVRATARYHLDLRAALARRSDQGNIVRRREATEAEAAA